MDATEHEWVVGEGPPFNVVRIFAGGLGWLEEPDVSELEIGERLVIVIAPLEAVRGSEHYIG